MKKIIGIFIIFSFLLIENTYHQHFYSKNPNCVLCKLNIGNKDKIIKKDKVIIFKRISEKVFFNSEIKKESLYSPFCFKIRGPPYCPI